MPSARTASAICSCRGGDRVQLTDDGLATAGAVEHVYDPWRYPDDWVVESFAPEGPEDHAPRRATSTWSPRSAARPGRRPATWSIAARSRSIDGPVGELPAQSDRAHRRAREKWWSRGHATLVEGPSGNWWMRLSRLRERLLDARPPDAARADRVDRRRLVPSRASDLSTAIPKPASSRNQTARHRAVRRFQRPTGSAPNGLLFVRAPTRWRAWPTQTARCTQRQRRQPGRCSPISCISGDQAYRCEAEIEAEGAATGGVLLFYNKRMYCGAGLRRRSSYVIATALDAPRAKPSSDRRLFIRLRTTATS